MKRVIFIPADTGQDVRVSEQPKAPTLAQLQAMVSGYIEVVPLWGQFDGQRCTGYCNEDGKVRGLPINLRATALWWKVIGRRVDDALVGDVAIVANAPREKRTQP